MKVNKIVSSTLVAAMVAGMFATSAFAAGDTFDKQIMAGKKVKFGPGEEYVFVSDETWYVGSDSSDNRVYQGSNCQFIHEDSGYTLHAYLPESPEQVIPVPVVSRKDSKGNAGQFVELDTFVMGDVTRFNTTNNITLSGIERNRAYNGDIPNVKSTEIIELRGYDFQKGLLPGDILLRGAKMPQDLNTYIKYGDESEVMNYLSVHDDGSIYTFSGSGSGDLVFELPEDKNAWKVVSRTCVTENAPANPVAVTTFEIEPIVYDYGQYTVNLDGVELSTSSAPDSIALNRYACYPSTANKVYKYEPLTIYAPSTNNYPFTVTYNDKTYTLKDFQRTAAGQYFFTIDSVEGDITVTGRKVSYTGQKTVAKDGVPEVKMSDTKRGDLLNPIVNFSEASYDTVKLTNYAGGEAGTTKTIEDVKNVFFHNDGSLTVETSASATTYSLAEGCLCWEVLKNSDKTLSLWGLDKDISSYVSVELLDEITTYHDFPNIDKDVDAFITYMLIHDTTSNGFNVKYDVTVDLNGRTLTLSEGKSISIKDGATLTVKNGTISSNGSPIFVVDNNEAGTVYLDGVNLVNANFSSTEPIISAKEGSLDVIILNDFDFNYNKKTHLLSSGSKGVRLISDERRADLAADGIADGCYNGLDGKEPDFSYIYTYNTHEWDESTYDYVWDPTSQGYSCSASVTCKNNTSHTVAEEVNGVLNTTPPTCTQDGKDVYTATFTNEAFETQTKEVKIPATGHRWGEVTYTWNAAKTECTASRICLNDPDHVDSETVAAKELEEGLDIWVATFENPDFEGQTVRGESWVMINRSDLANESTFNDASKKFYLDSNGNASSSALTNKFIDRDLVIDLNGLLFTVEDVRLAKDRTLHFIDLSEGKTGRVDISAAGTYGISSSAAKEDGYSYVILDGVRVNKKGGKPAFMVKDTALLKGNLEVSVMEGTQFTFEMNYNRTIFQVYGNDAGTRITVNSDVAFPDTSNYQNTPFDGQLVTQVNDGEGFRYKYILTNKINAPYVAGHALTLEDNIGVDFYVMLPDYYFNDNTEVTFEWGEGDYRKSATINGSSLTKINKTSTEQTYNCIIKCGVAARCMTDEIKMTVTYNDSEVLTDTYRVVDYAAQASAVYSDKGALIKLLCDMLDYGGAAQTYFEYRTDDLASSYISKVDKDWARTSSPESLTDTSVIDADAMLAAGLEYKGASIACTDKTILRIYFKASEDTISGTTFTYGGKEITPVEASGMYCLEFFEINPQDIFGDNAVYNIGIDISGTYVNLVYDTARYYNNLFQPTENQSVLNFRPVIRAMYQYSQSAKNYNG